MEDLFTRAAGAPVRVALAEPPATPEPAPPPSPPAGAAAGASFGPPAGSSAGLSAAPALSAPRPTSAPPAPVEPQGDPTAHPLVREALAAFRAKVVSVQPRRRSNQEGQPESKP